MMRSILAMTVLAGCAAPRPHGSAHFALEEGSCAALCVTRIVATLVQDGKEHTAEAPCGGTARFDDLTPGSEVVVTASLVAADGAVRLTGSSSPVLVTAGQDVPVTVTLHPTEAPVIAGLYPPVLAPPGAEAQGLYVGGTGFGAGAGASRVLLGEEELSRIGWGDDAATVSVAPGSVSGDVTVVACGVPAEPVPLRILAASPSQSWLSLPVCPGGASPSVRALASAIEGVYVAVACPVGGYATRMRPDDCTFKGGTTALEGEPVAAAAADALLWVVSRGPARLSTAVGGTEQVVAELTSDPTGVAAAPGGLVWLVVGGRLQQLGAEGPYAVPGIDSGLDVRAVVTVGTSLIATARGATTGRVLFIDSTTQGVTERVLQQCADPKALGSDGYRAYIACGSVVDVLDYATLAEVPIGVPGDIAALAVDWEASLVFAAHATGVSAVVPELGAPVTWSELGPVTRAATWGLSPGSALVIGAGGSVLRLGTLTGGPPCGGG